MDTDRRDPSTGRPGTPQTRAPGRPPDLTGWRRRQLLAAGFPDDLARTLADRPDVDLHALLQLVDRDCPPALAARILAPVEDAEAPS